MPLDNFDGIPFFFFIVAQNNIRHTGFSVIPKPDSVTEYSLNNCVVLNVCII